MSSALRHPRRGITISELLVAAAIAMVFVGGVAAAFTQIIKASNEAEAQIRGHAAARAAVDKIATELRQVSIPAGPFYQEFRIINQTLSYGNGIDEDMDGLIDEEVFDGFDTDNDWGMVHDNHQEISGQFEREPYIGVPDFGDLHVDEDCRFSHDVVSFIIPPSARGPRQRITYRIDSFDGEDNVLIRAVTNNPSQNGFGFDIETIEPVVFEVVSLDVLGWNANSDAVGPVPDQPYWVDSWDASTKTFPPLQVINSPFGTPPFKLPAAVLLSVTVNATGQPLADVPNWPPPGGGQLRTISVTTIVNIESVIKDTRYREYVRQ